ncbi:Breast cancer suppressor protein BRCT [Paramyrothecium foliicola]|nr:Breast cancer suppressor protein BRCT [Paramyrothecium foliicola]
MLADAPQASVQPSASPPTSAATPAPTNAPAAAPVTGFTAISAAAATSPVGATAPPAVTAPPPPLPPLPGSSLSPAAIPGLHENPLHHPVAASASPSHHHVYHPASPPMRKDTSSSISTQATTATLASTETSNTSYSADTSPNLHQSIFSVKDGSDVSNSRRTSRRRTGPLSQQSRERAALIRKLGACNDCRRRRVACHPSHHNLTWEDVVSKFHRSHSPSIQDIAPSVVAARPLSPAPALADTQPIFAHDSQEMDLDPSTPTHPLPGRLPLSEARMRTPLPSGPRLEKSLSLPGIESLKNDLQANASQILSASNRSRYNTVHCLFLFWQDDDDALAVSNAARELADVMDKYYHYTFQIQPIPSSDSFRSSSRWLARQVSDFAEDRDQRDVLKIIYYGGHTYLDENRDMVLASSRDYNKASTIRWSSIQQILEEACSDSLIVMDAAYFPSSKLIRQRGVLELVAASVSEKHFSAIDRCVFTRAVAEQLRTRAIRQKPLSAAELHSTLLSSYPRIVQDPHPEQDIITSFPAPFHTMISSTSNLPSILLAPLQPKSPRRNSFLFENNPQIHLSITLNDDNVDVDSWNAWLRLMPEGIRDVKVEGPFRLANRNDNVNGRVLRSAGSEYPPTVMESPPKRVTRSRAAAKVTEPPAKTTKIVTAAARARTASTATASTKSTAAKRKTRSDEDEADGGSADQQQSAAKRPARGRPRKVAAAEEAPDPAVPKTTRTRITRKVIPEAAKVESAPARATRGRPRKTVEPKTEEQPIQETQPKTTRGRAATTTKPAIAVSNKPAVKKTVKFQEPDKENLEPLPKTKEPTTSGLRGRPVRRAAAGAPRTTRAATKSSDEAVKKPLSPKKVTQMPVSRDRDESEDELAVEEKTPFMALMKSPIKPPAGISDKDKQLVQSAVEAEEETTMMVNAAILDPPDLTVSVLASPARRPPSSPFKDTLKSPARKMGAVALPGSTIKAAGTNTTQTGQPASFKASLLNSPAKRPQSPIKGLNFGSVTKPQHTQSAMKMSMFQSPAKRAMPGFKPLTEPRGLNSATLNDSPLPKPLIVSTPTPANRSRQSEKLMLEDEPSNDDEAVFSDSIEELQFPGRLSAVLPRHADPALQQGSVSPTPANPVDSLSSVEETPVAGNAVTQELEGEGLAEEERLSENPEAEIYVSGPQSPELGAVIETSADNSITVSTSSPVSACNEEPDMFQLRHKDLNSCHIDYDSDEDLTTELSIQIATPTSTLRQVSPGKSIGSTQIASKGSRRSTLGFTLLAEQFGAWSAASPRKSVPVAAETDTGSVTAPTEDSPASAHFFEDEMLARPNSATEETPAVAVFETEAQAIEIDEPSFDDILVTEEDVALAEEANDMSVLEPEEIEQFTNHSQSFDDSLSDASQEYGDENQVPLDPAMTGRATYGAPSTPVRPVTMSFHTTTKVPLKPADDSTPSPLKKRSFSASRVAPKRPSALSRSATVISYSPSKENKRQSVTSKPKALAPTPATPPPVTPTKTDIWSTLGTPARTPRRDIDSNLLRGAIVHVDVYTSDGADAGSIFVELLTQMGARCVDTWNWSNGSDHDEVSSAKVGITHVVYKDGAKETLEKVRSAGGIVHCVGVGWVLDCERENEWLDEGPYRVSTSVTPRGKGSRRKTMEPTVLAGLNEACLSIQPKTDSAARNIKSAPNTPLNRRDSTVWMHTPSEQGIEDVEEDDMAWPLAVLTPVPKTPAPEAIARYVADMPDTPSVGEVEIEDSPTKPSLLMRTCPPKSKYQDLGNGILSRDKDEQVLMRLMAARRKSLQFAPKIGSPLAKTWA